MRHLMMLLLGMSASHISVWHWVSTSVSDPAACQCKWKAQVLGFLSPMQEVWMQFLAPDIELVSYSVAGICRWYISFWLFVFQIKKTSVKMEMWDLWEVVKLCGFRQRRINTLKKGPRGCKNAAGRPPLLNQLLVMGVTDFRVYEKNAVQFVILWLKQLE